MPSISYDRSLSQSRWSPRALLGVVLAAGVSTPALAQQFVPVDPFRTYLRTAQDPDSQNVFPIDLANFQAGPGCILELERIGEFTFADGPDTLSAMVVAFSSDAALLPNPPESDMSCYNRVPGVLDAGIPPIVTPLTNLTPSIIIDTDTYISDTDFSIDGAKLFVVGATLTIDGEHVFPSVSVTGGGAGGSLLVEAGSLTGIAALRAPGGNGNSVGGGGGGGRIAVYSCDIDPRMQYTVSGGSGGMAGENGTLVLEALGVGMNPEDQTVDVGLTAEFSVIALGTGINYQWMLNGQPLTDGQTPHGSVIQGATSLSLTIENVQIEDLGEYAVEITNACDALVSESATLAQECTADMNGDGLVDTRDAILFFNLWSAGDPTADFNGDGAIDSRDIISFLNAWSAGC